MFFIITLCYKYMYNNFMPKIAYNETCITICSNTSKKYNNILIESSYFSIFKYNKTYPYNKHKPYTGYHNICPSDTIEVCAIDNYKIEITLYRILYLLTLFLTYCPVFDEYNYYNIYVLLCLFIYLLLICMIYFVIKFLIYYTISVLYISIMYIIIIYNIFDHEKYIDYMTIYIISRLTIATMLYIYIVYIK